MAIVYGYSYSFFTLVRVIAQGSDENQESHHDLRELEGFTSQPEREMGNIKLLWLIFVYFLPDIIDISIFFEIMVDRYYLVLLSSNHVRINQ